MTRPRAIPVLLLWALLPLAAGAQPPAADADPAAAETAPAERWLRLDLVVFERVRAAPSYLNDAWRFRNDGPALAVDAADPLALARVEVLTLPREQHQLANLAAALDRRGGYRVLLEQTFIQPPRARAEAPPLRVHDQIALALRDTPSFSDSGFSWMAPDSALAFAQPPVWVDRLDGTVTFFRERYLHLALDLGLIEPLAGIPAPAVDPDGRLEYEVGNVQSYRIRTQRRVRTDEVHYFDHPEFGVLAKLSWIPVDQLPPKPEMPPVEQGPGSSAQALPSGFPDRSY